VLITPLRPVVVIVRNVLVTQKTKIMDAITFEIEVAKTVENAVCRELQCDIMEIVGQRDTQAKKVVVYLLVTLHGYNGRTLGRKYQMPPLYVPTAVSQIEGQMIRCRKFENTIFNIIKKITI
jgi:hypothetical protein